MNRKLLFAILFVLPIGLRAQSSGNTGFLRTDLISPSPTAANLGKYGDVPVSYYTGLPNVSIPIFNVTGNELSLPITLTYNYSGFQPTQKASWVGLGWSLQAGGVITRSIGDKVDDHPIKPYDKDSVGRINPTQTYLNQSIAHSVYDNQPDVFSFNFGNYSGKFIWYENQAYLMPFQKLQITGGMAGFTIATEDGTKYRFDEIEQTSPRPSAGSPYTIPTYVSSWYLTKITNASGNESITLQYDTEGMMLQFGVRSQLYRKFIQTLDQVQQHSYNPIETPSVPTDIFPTRVNVKRLRSITSEKFKVEFDPEELNREDINVDAGATSRALKSIRILSNELTLIKRLDFEYDYFGTGGINSKYLKLKSLIDRGASIGGKFQEHSFEYQNETSNYGNGVDSYVDKYGYFKGQSMPNNMYISEDVYPAGTDREPNGNAVYGALVKVSYPTGGSTTFTYENNRIYDGDRYIVYDDGAAQTAVRSNPSTTNIISMVDTFNITTGQYVQLFFSRIPKYIYPVGEPPPVYIGSYNDTDVEIRPVYNILDDEGVPIGETVGNAVYSGEIVLYANNGGQTDSTFLNAGKYILVVICDDEENEVHGNLSSKVYTDTPVPGLLGPGIRINQLTHNNGVGISMTKSFYYVNEQGFSSGVSLQNSFFDTKPYFKCLQSAGVTLPFQVAVLQYQVYSSTLAETQGFGLPFYYKRVVEETQSQKDTLRSDYSYQYFNGHSGVELISKNDYNKSGSEFSKVQMVENYFSNEFTDFVFPNLTGYVLKETVPLEGGQPFNPIYDFQHFLHSGVWKHPRLTRETQYGDNGSLLVSETKSYYDVSGHRNIVGTKRINSDGTSYYTRYKYPEDYTSSITSSLVDANMLSPVLEEQVWRKNPGGDSVMISGKIVEYANKRVSAIYSFESPTGISTLTNETKSGNKYNTLFSDVRYQKKIEFSYDASGRVISQKLENNHPISYIWEHSALPESGSVVLGKTYPIAKIENALPDKVFYSSFEDASGTVQSSKTGYRSRSGSFTIPVTFTGNYKLTYWKKTGTNPWQLVIQDLVNPNNYVIDAVGSVIDEVRLYPTTAQITTYTYKVGIGLSSVNDPNNKLTYYKYDDLGRLKLIEDDKGNIISNYKYHIKNEGAGTVVIE